MKIFVHVYGSFIDEIFTDRCLFKDINSYEQDIYNILRFGSASQLGIDPSYFGKKNFVCYTNSKYLQQKWAHENDIKIDQNWRRKITREQIASFKPDVLLTLSPAWLLDNYDLIENIRLKTFWKASPIYDNHDYSKFDLGLTYHTNYAQVIKNAGCSNVELHHFGFDPKVYDRLPNSTKDIDLSFVGTYNKQFKRRNHLLKVISKKNILPYKKIQFILRVGTGVRIRGLIPNIPPVIYMRYKPPMYLRQMLSELKASKITFNCHSDMAGNGKGNMRVYEALATKSLLLSDAGNYPKYLKEGENFITYKNEKDLLDKLRYFWKNDLEREQIAENGYNILKKHYSLISRKEHLFSIFQRNL